MTDILTTRQAADAINAADHGSAISEWQVRRLYEDGELPEPQKFAGKRIVQRSELPLIVAALRRRGWLPMMEVAAS